MSSKLRLWFGGAVGLLLVVVLARCGNDGPVTTGVDHSGGLTEARAPRATDPNPPGWVGGISILSHDGFPTDIDFEGAGLGCFTPVAEQFAAEGVHFSGGAQSLTDPPCLNSFNYPPHSPITVLAEFTDGIITIDFDAPQGDVGVRYNTLFALTMTCYTGAGGTGGVVGADAATFPNLDNFGPSIAPPNETLQVTGAGILSCVLAGTPGFFTLDDLFGDNITAITGPGTCQGQFTSPGVSSFTFNGVTTFIGTSGPDVIGGTDHIDFVIAKGGDDLICTWFGADVVDGGPGDDTVFGGDQKDRIFGKEGADLLFGEAGADRLDGGHTPVPSSLPDTQPDTCVGGPGINDRFYLCETIFQDDIIISSIRFKQDVVELLPVGKTILGLRPVAFRYLEAYGDPSAPQVGLVAEEVFRVYPEAVVLDEEDRPYAIHYGTLNALLLEDVGRRSSAVLEDRIAQLAGLL